MSCQKVENLLKKLAGLTEKDPPENLAKDIKKQIPNSINNQKKHDTINIMIDLRISKLTAAAAIIITMLVFFGIYSDNNSGSGLYQESKILLNYILGPANKKEHSGYTAWHNYYKQLKKEGKQAYYFGDRIELDDPNAILMYWKDANDQYRVIYGDLRVTTVKQDQLIHLQSEMLRKQ